MNFHLVLVMILVVLVVTMDRVNFASIHHATMVYSKALAVHARATPVHWVVFVVKTTLINRV